MTVKVFMRRVTAAAIAVIISVTALCGCGKYSEGDELAMMGFEKYNEQSYAEALQYLEQADTLELKSVKPEKMLAYLGDAYYKTGDYEKSIDAHARAIVYNRELFSSWVTIGVCSRKLGDKSAALNAYNEALKYDPQNSLSVGLYVSLGSLYLEKNKPYTAIQYLEKALELYPEQPAVHAYLAIAYAMTYEQEKSEIELAKAESLGFSGVDEVKKQIQKIENA